MDRREIYIKMCEKATEIQDLRPYGKPWVQGDGFITEGKLTKYRIAARHKEDLWLPHQDQLQAMVFGISGDIQGQVWKLYEFVTPNRATCPRVSSMEQLWLAFVMKEKYNKVWNGEDWVVGA